MASISLRQACAALLIAGGLCGTASANLTIYPMALSVGGTAPAANTVQIYSKSDETQYVRAVVKQVVDPATDKEREVPASSWQGTGIVVSPLKFALPAGATRAVRIISMAAPNTENVYRVYFESVPPPRPDGTTPQENGKVSVNIVWGVLVHALPDTAQPLLARRNGGKELANVGNVHVTVRQVANCQDRDSRCSWTDVNRNVYPGATYTLPADLARSPAVRVKYQVEGQEVQQRDVAISG